MRNIYLLLIISLSVAACKKDKNPKHQPKQIIVSGSVNYTANLSYSGDKLASYTNSTSGVTFQFTYDGSGRLSRIDRTGGDMTRRYNIIRQGSDVIRTESESLVNGSWIKGESYTYSNDPLNNRFQLNVHNIDNTIAYSSMAILENKRIVGFEDSDRVLTWKQSGNDPGPFFLYFPNFPIALLDLPNLTNEVGMGQNIAYSYRY